MPKAKARALKYHNFVKAIPFMNFEEGGFRRGAILDKNWLGFDVHIKYGSYWLAGRMGKEPYVAHMHDFDQVLLFAGSDMNDIGDLGAEVEFCIGEELERHIITTTTAIAIPKGTPHFPATIHVLNRPFFYYEISLTAEYHEKPVPTRKEPGPIAVFRSATKKYIMPLAFIRKGAWHYGPTNRDDSGGYLAFVQTKEAAGFDFVMLYESIKRGPYRIGPDPDKPHAHPTTQIMLFLSTDPYNMEDLGAEFEICLGKEMERHKFTKSTAVLTPPFLPHWPGGVVKLERPIIMCDIHPFGNER
ncbi:MAG: hypothetical protein RMJ15_06740 [Nitrososphaerota archaeon]|nr:hypothetical protein [Candidatus Bathyarchaeota archaeon]MDW8023416.1 hypothetical protein [Nitrososphaerota archaeon]